MHGRDGRVEEGRREPRENHPEESDGPPGPRGETSQEGGRAPRPRGAAWREPLMVPPAARLQPAGAPTFSRGPADRPVKVLDEGLRVFEADTHPHQPFRDPTRPPPVLRERTVRHRNGKVHE